MIDIENKAYGVKYADSFKTPHSINLSKIDNWKLGNTTLKRLVASSSLDSNFDKGFIKNPSVEKTDNADYVVVNVAWFIAAKIVGNQPVAAKNAAEGLCNLVSVIEEPDSSGIKVSSFGKAKIGYTREYLKALIEYIIDKYNLIDLIEE